MKTAQHTFTLQSDFSQLKINREAAMIPLYIDLAIYDLMADRRKRSVNEVVSQLALLGYNRKDVNRRMVVMLHKSQMFVEAKGGKGKVLYELKKGAKRPDFTSGEAKTVDTVKESEIVLQPTHVSVPVTYRKHRTFNLSETTMQNQQPTTSGSVSAQWDTIHQHLADGLPDPTSPYPTEATPPQDLTVQPNDPVRVALWKVMSDHAWYKSSDLVTLLTDFYPSDIVRYHLRFMAKHDMVTVDKSSYQEFKYRLNDDVKMPEGLEPYKPNIPLATTSPQPQLPLTQEPEMTKVELPINTQLTIKKQADFPVGASADAPQPQDADVAQFKNPAEPQQPVTTLPDLVKAASEEPARGLATLPSYDEQLAAEEAKAAPLVEVGGIVIKGQRFSYKEARELLAELKAEGYGNLQGVVGHRAGKHITVRWSVTIGVAQVTPAQANDIALSLIDELE